MEIRAKAAAISIASNTVLVLGKLAVGLAINSVSVLSEAIHSGMDLLASLIAFFSVQVASKPADDGHHYGHGKIENISGTIEALLIFLAAAWIIYEAVRKIFTGNSPLGEPVIGVAVMAAATIINYFISRYLFKVAAATESIALEADAWHLRTDVYTSLGVTASLLIIYFTGLYWLDSLVALVVAAMIIKAAWHLAWEAMLPLMDVSLPAEEVQVIKEVIARHADRYVEFHKLRTRKAGRDRQVDLHLVVPHYDNIARVHALCEHISDEVKQALPYVDILIHAEPCDEPRECQDCYQCPQKEKHTFTANEYLNDQ